LYGTGGGLSAGSGDGSVRSALRSADRASWLCALSVVTPPAPPARRAPPRPAPAEPGSLELGEDLEATERQLLRWRFHPALAREAAAWAWDRHRAALAAAEQVGAGVSG